MNLTRRRSFLLAALVAVAAVLGLLVFTGSCAMPAKTSGFEPRYVAVHNAFAAIGLVEVGPIQRGSLAEGAEAKIPIELGAQCTAIVVMGTDGVRDLDLTLLDPSGAAVARDSAHEPEATVRVCLENAGAYTLGIKMASGAGDYLLATWVAAAAAGGGATAGAASTMGQPAAGTCEAPIRIGAGEYAGSTTHGESDNEGQCANSSAREIVYRLDLTARQDVSIDVTTQRFDSVLYVRKDDCGDESAEVACNDDAPNQHRSKIEAVFDPGTYYVFVDGYSNDGGSFRMHVTLRDIPALAEVCRKAQPLALGIPEAGETAGTFDEVSASCGDGARGPDTPYAFEVPGRSRARIVDYSDDFTPVVHLRSRCADEASEVGCAGAETGEHRATFVGLLDPGAYTVFSDTSDHDADGRYSLTAELAPEGGSGGPGDSCADATPLQKSETVVNGDTFTARDDTSGKCGGAGAADVFYRVELPKRSRFVTRLTSEEAPHVFILSKACADRSTEVACGRAIDETLAAGTYFLAVDGNAPDAFGAFVFEWSARDVAAQETGCRAPPLLSDGQSVAGTTSGASNKFMTSCGAQGGVDSSGDRVYRVTIAARSRVRLSLSTPQWNGVLALRSSCLDTPGNSPRSSEVACNASADDAHHAHLESNLEPGTYYVVVDGRGRDREGAYTLDYRVMR
jgi:hypothetical protein